jgi:lipoprotein-releasing system ATP-binding protein
MPEIDPLSGYTEEARSIILLAAQEARRLKSPIVEQEHLILGVFQFQRAGGTAPSTADRIRLSPECERVLAYCMEEGRLLGHERIGTGHILLGFLRQHSQSDLAPKVLTPDPVDPVLACENLKKAYPTAAGELVVFDGLNLAVAEGERVAIVGQSGCGKSTLLHLLGGLDRPTGGTIRYRSRDISSLGESKAARYRNRHVGFVWQIHYLLPEFTALENAMMPLLIRGEAREAAAERAQKLLKDVGLEARATHRAGELSGGEQQRVVLARALVGQPSVLLADEPTGNLDARTGEQIFGLIGDLHRQHRLTSVLVTHNLSFAAKCDRAFRLENGALVRYR